MTAEQSRPKAPPPEPDITGGWTVLEPVKPLSSPLPAHVTPKVSAIFRTAQSFRTLTVAAIIAGLVWLYASNNIVRALVFLGGYSGLVSMVEGSPERFRIAS